MTPSPRALLPALGGLALVAALGACSARSGTTEPARSEATPMSAPPSAIRALIASQLDSLRTEPPPAPVPAAEAERLSELPPLPGLEAPGRATLGRGRP